MKNLVSKWLAGIFLLVFACAAQAATVKMERKAVLNGLISLDVPVTFTPMSAEMLKMKYPSGTPPTEVYTNEAGSVNLAFNYTGAKMSSEKDLQAFGEMMKSRLASLKPQVSYFSVDERPAVMLEFISPAMDTQVHNVMMGMIVDGRLLMATFNATVAEQDQWVEAGKAALKSVKVNNP